MFLFGNGTSLDKFAFFFLGWGGGGGLGGGDDYHCRLYYLHIKRLWASSSSSTSQLV